MAMGTKSFQNYRVGRMKKGVMFSFIMFFLATTLISLILVQQSMISYRRRQLSVEIRVEDMKNFYNSILRDMGKVFNIILKRAISVTISDVVNEGEGRESADSTLTELVINGTLDGVSQELMENATIPYWVNKIMDLGDVKGYDVEIATEDFKIKPYDSWNLAVETDLQINITDKQGVASLEKTITITEIVPIEDFEDPLFPINTKGRGISIIKRNSNENNYTELLVSGEGNYTWKRGLSIIKNSSDVVEIQNIDNKGQKILVTDHAETLSYTLLNNFLGLVSENGMPNDVISTYVKNANNAMNLIPNDTYVLIDGDGNSVWYIENLRYDVENSIYHSSTSGASFLDRLEGKNFVQTKYSSQTNNTIGLERFLDKEYLISLDFGPVDTERTNIDYLYFSEYSGVVNGVKGLDIDFLDFKIDNEASLGSTHQVIYGVSNLLI